MSKMDGTLVSILQPENIPETFVAFDRFNVDGTDIKLRQSPNVAAALVTFDVLSILGTLYKE